MTTKATEATEATEATDPQVYGSLIIKLAKPEICIVGRPHIDRLGVTKFLKGLKLGDASAPLDYNAVWQVTDKEEVEDGDLIDELGGRVCYLSFGKAQHSKANRDYIRNILEHKHGSVLEHAVWNLTVTGVSRSLLTELTRHRAGCSFSVLSQRYVDESDVAFVVPEVIENHPDSNVFRRWCVEMAEARNSYIRHVEVLMEQQAQQANGVTLTQEQKRHLRIEARQAARSVLPNAAETKMLFSANGRALRHIIEARGSEFAEAEIRRFAVLLCGVMKREAPSIFQDFEVVTGSDGRPATRCQYSKV